MNETSTLTVANDSLSMFDLIIHASLLVQLVMIILVVASLVSWTLIFTKAAAFKKLRQEADRFDEIYYSGKVDLNDFWQDLSGEAEESKGMASIFVKGYGEHVRLTQAGQINKDDLVKLRLEKYENIGHYSLNNNENHE